MKDENIICNCGMHYCIMMLLYMMNDYQWIRVESWCDPWRLWMKVVKLMNVHILNCWSTYGGGATWLWIVVIELCFLFPTTPSVDKYAMIRTWMLSYDYDSVWYDEYKVNLMNTIWLCYEWTLLYVDGSMMKGYSHLRTCELYDEWWVESLMHSLLN